MILLSSLDLSTGDLNCYEAEPDYSHSDAGVTLHSSHCEAIMAMSSKSTLQSLLKSPSGLTKHTGPSAGETSMAASELAFA